MTPCRIAALRTAMRAIEQAGAGRLGLLPLGGAGEGAPALQRGCLHEMAGPAAAVFAALALARAEGPVLWCVREEARGLPYPPGLAQTGLAPERLVLARPRQSDDLLAAAHEGLRAGWDVVLELAGSVGLGPGRRLQLAAEAGGGLGLILADGEAGAGAPLMLAAATRWQASMADGPVWPDPLRLDLYLVRNRHGPPGQWRVEWDYASRSLSVVPAAADRQDRAPRRAIA